MPVPPCCWRSRTP